MKQVNHAPARARFKGFGALVAAALAISLCLPVAVWPAAGVPAAVQAAWANEGLAAATAVEPNADAGSSQHAAPVQAAAPEAAVWTGQADISWYVAGQKSFALSTPEQLAGLAQIVNGTAQGIERDAFEGKTVSLTADVRLNAANGKQAWTAIGDINVGKEHATSTDVYFDGTFDGAGHVVEGLYMPSSSENYGGYHAFFGSLGPHAVVQKLGIGSGAVYGRVAAGIAAVSRVADAESLPRIIGCFNKADIYGNGATSRGCAGIFAGENQVGNEGSGVGYRAAAYIADCYNMGSVTSSGPCGGIAGTGSVKVYGCYNTGNISSSTGGSAHGALVGNLFVAGSRIAASFPGAGEVLCSYAYEGTDEWLLRAIDADHSIDDPLICDGEHSYGYYYEPSVAFLDVYMETASELLGASYVDDDPDNPQNDRMPLLWWQKGLCPIDISNAAVEDVPTQLYSGKAITPPLAVSVPDPTGASYDYVTLYRGSEYRVVYENNVDVGTAKATVYGVGRYEGEVEAVTFDIVQINLADCEIDPIAPQWFYGQAAKPAVVVRTGSDTVLDEGYDYTVVFRDNDKSGKASVELVSNGTSTTGTKMAYFYIVKASDSLAGSGTESDPYQLASKEDLQLVSHAMNIDDEAYINAFYTVTCDIDARAQDSNDLGIDPIGTNAHPFAGSFDGAGHTITVDMDADRISADISFSQYVYDYLGLFGATESAGTTTIKNLTLAGKVRSGGSAGAFIGVARDERLVIENCTNKASVTASGTADSKAAGFIAYAGGTLLTVTDCVNEGNVSGGPYASGIVCELNGGKGCHAFTHVGNAGAVRCSYSASGVIQHYKPTINSSFIAENCYNTGSVISTRVDGGAAGGILGMDQSASANAGIDKPCQFVSCYNSGSVSGGRHGGGIAGQIYTTPMTFTGCYNTGTVADCSNIFGAGGICGAVAYQSAGWTFSSCYNAGVVSAGKDAHAAGGIVGWMYAGSVARLDNCYVREGTQGQSETKGVGGINERQGAQEPVVVTGEAEVLAESDMLLRGNDGFAAKLGSIFLDDRSDAGSWLNGGYPVCYWQRVVGKYDVDTFDISPIADQEYAGVPLAVQLEATVRIDSDDEQDVIRLMEGVDYTLSYENNVNPGLASITLTGLGRYVGSRTLNFNIVNGDISKCAVAAIPDQWSTESGAEPALTVTNPKGQKLVAGTDYVASYKDNVNTGTATVELTGAGYYEGSGRLAAQFKVVRASDGLRGAGTDEDPFVISTVNDFAYFMAKVNAGEGPYPFASYKLASDLDLKPEAGKPSIEPVGRQGNYFRGTFDGGGHTVTLYLDATEPYQGLFGIVDGAILKNITTAGSVHATVPEKNAGTETLAAAGALAGYAFDTLRVENCTNAAEVTSNGSCVAGFVGVLDSKGCTADFANCANMGDIRSDRELAAGFVGDCRAAKLTLRDCVNSGAVLADFTAAGLVARIGGDVSETSKAQVAGSCNVGSISGKYRSGGLVGSILANAAVTVRNSYNTGDISSLLADGYSSYASGMGANGGLVGGVNAQAGLSIDKAYNAGKVVSTDSTFAAGGLVGYVNAQASQLRITASYYVWQASSIGNKMFEDAVDMSACVSDTVMKSATMPAKLGGEFGFDSYGVNGGYPIIGAQRRNIADCGFSPVAPQEYTGVAIVPPVVAYDTAYKKTLVAGSDYLLVGEDNVDAGSATVHVVGTGAYAGQKTLSFEIQPANLADCTIAPIPDQPMTGKPATPELEIANERGIALVSGRDYTVNYAGNDSEGEACAIVVGKGNYKGSLTATFNVIELTDITGKAVIEPIAKQTYSGAALTPAVSVLLDGAPMLEGSEFSVEYFDNVDVGTARVVVTGMGTYAGSVEATFAIAPRSIAGAKVGPISDAVYTGAAVKPAPTVVLDGATLTLDRDYTLSYRNNVNAGTGVVVVAGKGFYTGAVEATFTIKPQTITQVVIDKPSGGASGGTANSGGASNAASGTVSQGASNTSAESTAEKSATKKANTMKVKAATKTVKASKLKKAKRSVKAITVKKARGTVTYARVKKGSSAKLSVNKKTGAITVKKGTKKGTYKVRVKVTAKGNASYKALSKTVTVKVKVN